MTEKTKGDMILGMKRGTVYLVEHRTEWETAAAEAIRILRNILGADAAEIQHIGSTSVRTIPAKPIIDIAVGVRDYDAVLGKKELLEQAQIIFRIDERPEQLLFVMGDFENDTRTHHIHVVLYGSKEWNDYIRFKDYLNTHDGAAKRYAALKAELARKYPNNREAYTQGKSRLIAELLSEAYGGVD